eukprot:TRINITY_DN14596_c0_g1_i2.p1 TRINITY_DN14596_c0_g1~~TRINITY_DN14596_c0_g1_i2.p1  ORF type:complete len:429 (-),score=40.91 TRINITY_DN14596_c0_g1_i2:274-1560(-)
MCIRDSSGFEQFDTNRDGNIDREEWNALVQSRARKSRVMLAALARAKGHAGMYGSFWSWARRHWDHKSRASGSMASGSMATAAWEDVWNQALGEIVSSPEIQLLVEGLGHTPSELRRAQEAISIMGVDRVARLTAYRMLADSRKLQLALRAVEQVSGVASDHHRHDHHCHDNSELYQCVQLYATVSERGLEGLDPHPRGPDPEVCCFRFCTRLIMPRDWHLLGTHDLLTGRNFSWTVVPPRSHGAVAWLLAALLNGYLVHGLSRIASGQLDVLDGVGYQAVQGSSPIGGGSRPMKTSPSPAGAEVETCSRRVQATTVFSSSPHHVKLCDVGRTLFRPSTSRTPSPSTSCMPPRPSTSRTPPREEPPEEPLIQPAQPIPPGFASRGQGVGRRQGSEGRSQSRSPQAWRSTWGIPVDKHYDYVTLSGKRM